MIKSREELKEYFQTGDKPTQGQFSNLIDSMVHKDEDAVNFGLNIRIQKEKKTKWFNFYTSSGTDHKIIEGTQNGTPPTVAGFTFQNKLKLNYDQLRIDTFGNIDFENHNPTLIIERYKQKKLLASGKFRPAGYIKEKNTDAVLYNRKSEIPLTSNSQIIDFNPVYYFRYKDGTFLPSGATYSPRNFDLEENPRAKIFNAYLQFKIQITINGQVQVSEPKRMKIRVVKNEAFVLEYN